MFLLSIFLYVVVVNQHQVLKYFHLFLVENEIIKTYSLVIIGTYLRQPQRNIRDVSAHVDLSLQQYAPRRGQGQAKEVGYCVHCF